jgi:hypothetical protein
MLRHRPSSGSDRRLTGVAQAGEELRSLARDEATQAFAALDAYLRRVDYKGYEFDDLLGSPFVSRLTFGNLFLQRVAVQAGRLSPLNFRPVVGVRKRESTKARGFFARGYLHRYLATEDERWLTSAVACLDWLLEHHSHGYDGLSWGNAFPFASRSGFFPEGHPTVVWTAHIAEGFQLGYEVTGRPEYRAAVERAGEFVLRSLERHEDAQGICLAYAPGLLPLIHNSNLLGASLLLRYHEHGGDEDCLEVARAAYRWSIAHMNADGSWYYGVESNHRWIDSFHTAYTIDCLLLGHELGGEETVPFSVVERTYDFWTERFFGPDGACHYYHDRVGPIDVQCAAQALETLARTGRAFPGAPALADRVLHWSVATLRKPNGAFRYRVGKYVDNELESIHWGQATMLSALGAYLNASADGTGRGAEAR